MPAPTYRIVAFLHLRGTVAPASSRRCARKAQASPDYTHWNILSMFSSVVLTFCQMPANSR